MAESIINTDDEGYALAGARSRQDAYGEWHDDFWLIKTDSWGNMIWNQTYSHPFWLGIRFDDAHATSLVQTSDGGYAIFGSEPVESWDDEYEFWWLVRTDSLGHMLWNTTLGHKGG